MKNILFLLFVLFLTSSLSAQIKIENDNYKFYIEFSSGWKTGNKVETNKNDVITYSFTNSNNKEAATIIAFKFSTQRNLDDFIYTLEKDFNLNIPAKTNGYTSINGDDYEGKSAVYMDNETLEKIYYYTTTKESSGDYFCYMIRFIAESQKNQNDFDTEVSNISNTFRIKL